MSKQFFHGRMMNVQAAHNAGTPLDTYAVGHRDARHACAEIALEADADIGGLRGACREALLYINGTTYGYADDEEQESPDVALGLLRAALAAAEGRKDA